MSFQSSGQLDGVIGKGADSGYRSYAKSQGQPVQTRAQLKAAKNPFNQSASSGQLDTAIGQGPDNSYTQFLKQQQADSQQKQQQLAQQLVQKQQQIKAPTPNAPATKPPSGLLGGISTYAKALVTSPVGTIKDIASGQHIKAVDNGALIVDRAPQSYTAPIKAAQAGNLPKGTPGQLDHTVPLEIGGTNAKGNLKLIPKAQDQANNSVEDYLGGQLKANVINAQQAQQLNNDYKAGKITAQDVYNKAKAGGMSRAPGALSRGATAISNDVTSAWQHANPFSGLNRANDLIGQTQQQYGLTPQFIKTLQKANTSLTNNSLAGGSATGLTWLPGKVPNQVNRSEVSVALPPKGTGGNNPTDTLVHEGLHQVWAANPQTHAQFATAYNQSTTPQLQQYLQKTLNVSAKVPLNDFNKMPPALQDEVHSAAVHYYTTGSNVAPPNNALTTYYGQFLNPAQAFHSNNQVQLPTGVNKADLQLYGDSQGNKWYEDAKGTHYPVGITQPKPTTSPFDKIGNAVAGIAKSVVDLPVSVVKAANQNVIQPIIHPPTAPNINGMGVAQAQAKAQQLMKTNRFSAQTKQLAQNSNGNPEVLKAITDPKATDQSVQTALQALKEADIQQQNKVLGTATEAASFGLGGAGKTVEAGLAKVIPAAAEKIAAKGAIKSLTGAAVRAGQNAVDQAPAGALFGGGNAGANNQNVFKGAAEGALATGALGAGGSLLKSGAKGALSPLSKPDLTSEKVASFNKMTADLQAQKGKLAELKAQHPANAPAIDNVIANADQKLAEVQKAQAKEPPQAVQTELGAPATPRPPTEVLNDIKTSTSAIHQASDGKTPADFITANGSKFTPKSSTPKELLPLVENHAELQTEYAAAKTSPDTIHAQIKDLLSSDKSYDQSGNVTPEVAKQVNGLNKQLNGLGERVPAADKPVSVKPTEPTVTRTPPIKTSKLAQGVEANAIKHGLTQGFEDKPEYAKVNIAQQTKAATDLLKNDPERAVRIAMGHERPPEGLLPESAFIAVEQAATKSGNVDLIRRLATESHLTSEATGMGQRIRMLGERENTSPVSAIKKVQEARTAAFEKRTGKSATKAVSDEIKAIRAAKPKVTRMDWGQWVESIRC